MEKGILVYALGHKNYYRMAEVLAASLVANGAKEDNIGIAVVVDDPEKILYPELFTEVITLPEKNYKEKDKVVFNNATVLVYDLSPFETTIKLDADIVWIKNRRVLNIFEELNDVDITFENMGHGWGDGNSVWASEDDIKSVYNITEEKKLYKIYGEFIYFKKNDVVKSFFKGVKDVYKKRKVKSAAFANGNFTDELAFQITGMLTDTYPHKDFYTPIYNTFLLKTEFNRFYPYQLGQLGYYGYSIGGNVTGSFTKTNYNNLAKHYYNAVGLSNPYQVSDKRTFLEERKPL